MHELIHRLVEEQRALACSVNDQIWAMPELGFEEFRSSALLSDTLEQNGFTVERGVAGMPTAFIASYGDGKPVLGLLAEFDALSGMSQQSGVPEQLPLEAGAPGHGCGHNAIGASCLAAALALKNAMDEKGLHGTVRVYGCPAEEQGSGKVFMVRDGLFNDVDAAITPHCMPSNAVMGFSSLANAQVEFAFTGKAAHAAGVPHMGRSALDAADLMIVGVQFLREHIIQEARIHHAYLDVGGTAPNVVQASAKLLFYIRAPKGQDVKEILERVSDVARGAALMTGTTVEIKFRSGMNDFIPNDTMGRTAAQAWADLGPCVYSPEAMAVAERMAPAVGADPAKGLVDTRVPQYVPVPTPMSGSTDVGDISYIVPTTGVLFAGIVKGTPGHSWQYVAQSGTPLMHDAMIHAAKVMALTGVRLMEDPAIVEAAHAELREKNPDGYVSIVPADVKPIR